MLWKRTCYFLIYISKVILKISSQEDFSECIELEGNRAEPVTIIETELIPFDNLFEDFSQEENLNHESILLNQPLDSESIITPVEEDPLLSEFQYQLDISESPNNNSTEDKPEKNLSEDVEIDLNWLDEIPDFEIRYISGE